MNNTIEKLREQLEQVANERNEISYRLVTAQNKIKELLGDVKCAEDQYEISERQCKGIIDALGPVSGFAQDYKNVHPANIVSDAVSRLVAFKLLVARLNGQADCRCGNFSIKELTKDNPTLKKMLE